jgi:hypothetical protein
MLDQVGVGDHVRLGAQVVLVDVAESAALKRGDAAKSMFIACAARQAAIETCKSSSRVRSPETDVNAPTNPGS